MKDISRRVRRIENYLATEKRKPYLRLPDPDRPGQTIEVEGCRTLAEFLKGYSDSEESE
jgi:hypothetical protein